jgi:hypothetical protein
MARNLLRLVLCAVVATLAAPSVAQQPTTKIARIGYLAGVSASADAPRWETSSSTSGTSAAISTGCPKPPPSWSRRSRTSWWR